MELQVYKKDCFIISAKELHELLKSYFDAGYKMGSKNESMLWKGEIKTHEVREVTR